MSAEIRGVEDVIKALDEKIGIDKIESNVRKACLIAERSAKQKAPKGRTGDLRKSIESEVVTDGDRVVGKIFSTLEYAPYIEYGTGAFAEQNPTSGYWVYVKEGGSDGGGGGVRASKRYTLEGAKWIVSRMREDGLDAVYTQGQKPQPFMRPALDENRLAIIEAIIKGVM